MRRRGVSSRLVDVGPTQTPPCRVTVLDRPSSHALTVLWSDACSGHYGEQTWRLVFAKRDALCALTGTEILKGDEVFRPRVKRNSLPANWDRMILASKISF
ncbi:DUF3331 domain-containing protein [Paraburkholderia unamae]|uniref:DUF3331 domain-containing protein n=1 Tax=Paraburkholderia unamae TaxID=219649 RepID=UPI0035A2241A